jgi:hypothetical protein
MGCARTLITPGMPKPWKEESPQGLDIPEERMVIHIRVVRKELVPRSVLAVRLRTNEEDAAPNDGHDEVMLLV